MSFIKNSIYWLLDILKLQKGYPAHINHYKVMFPAKWARYFEKDYEQENIAFITSTCTPGMTVIDIGAHLGLMSVIISKCIGSTGRIYAFEPTPGTFRVLQDVIAKNKAGAIITAVNSAISSFDGEMDFFMDEHEGSNANSLVNRPDKTRRAHKTTVHRLDTFVSSLNPGHLDLIKIDAEGSELDVLKGAAETIRRFRPRMILAIHPSLIKNNHHNIGDIFDLVTELGYTVFYRSALLDRQSFIANPDFFDVHLIPRN